MGRTAGFFGRAVDEGSKAVAFVFVPHAVRRPFRPSASPTSPCRPWTSSTSSWPTPARSSSSSCSPARPKPRAVLPYPPSKKKVRERGGGRTQHDRRRPQARSLSRPSWTARAASPRTPQTPRRGRPEGALAESRAHRTPHSAHHAPAPPSTLALQVRLCSQRSLRSSLVRVFHACASGLGASCARRMKRDAAAYLALGARLATAGVTRLNCIALIHPAQCASSPSRYRDSHPLQPLQSQRVLIRPHCACPPPRSGRRTSFLLQHRNQRHQSLAEW